jgi:hypothetical protein
MICLQNSFKCYPQWLLNYRYQAETDTSRAATLLFCVVLKEAILKMLQIFRSMITTQNFVSYNKLH